jgi:hypothetical protein
MGRPSSFSQKVADEICERIISGETLIEICEDEKMPTRRDTYRWMEDHPEFRTQCARAREHLADLFEHQIRDEIKHINPKTAHAVSVTLNGLQWLAMKACPARFGNKQEVTHEAGDTLTQFLDKVRKS